MEDYKLSTGDSKNEMTRVTKDRLYSEQRGEHRETQERREEAAKQ